MIDEQRFFAWLDGELDSADSAEVAEAVQRDPVLRAKTERHRAMTARLRRAFEPLSNEAVPLPTASVIDITEKRRDRRERRWWYDATALAATLVLGLVIGARFVASDSSPVAVSGEMLIASAGLERSLDRHLASAPPDKGHRIGLTFRDQAGRICRTFRDTASSGLACHENGSWAIEALVNAGEGQSGDFRMASGPDPRLADMVDEMIAGEPFNADQERAARERNWR